MEYCLQPSAEDGAVTPLVTCPEFQQRICRFDAATGENRDDERDEVLFVLGGRGEAFIAGETHPLEAGTGVFLARGTAWRIESADDLEILSVLIEEPLEATSTHAVIATGERGTATAGREFALLSHPDNGCASVTQFVGHIPAGRAPDHFHKYDEVVYILAGEGAFHTEGQSEPLEPGSCIHLPARLVHCLENFGPGEMRVLGVFRPAGSPAEAYYPDGTAAVVPVTS